MRYKVLLLSGLLLPPITGLGAQNEVSIGVSDLIHYRSENLTVKYKRYFDDVLANNQPYLISPYLNKTGYVSLKYAEQSIFDDYHFGGEWFFDKDWSVNAQVKYLDYDNISLDTFVMSNIGIGYFALPNWQVGAGLFNAYSKNYRVDYDPESGSITRLGTTYSNSTTDPKIFTRYTNIVDGSGWDLGAEVLFASELSTILTAQYFFNPAVSAEVKYFSSAGAAVQEDYILTGDDAVKINVHYWINPNFTVQIGGGLYVSGEGGLTNLSLSTSYRF